MQTGKVNLLRPFIALCALALLSGCSEGPFSSLGGLNPWVRQKWAEEERYVQSLYTRREQLQTLASRAKSMPQAEQERVSQDLAALVRDDPVHLLRVEAVKALAAFPTGTAASTLSAATKDKDADVRIAACLAMRQRPEQEALPILEEILRSDTDIDVRLAATDALGAFRSPSAVRSLGIALNDSDPAMQNRAMQSLRNASGRNLGTDAVAWRDFIQGTIGRPTEAPSVVDRFDNWLK